MSNGHHELSPSSFPAWALCPAFDSDPAEREDAAEGTAQHAALSALLSGKEAPLAALSPDACEAVQWAAQHVRTLAQGQDIEAERRGFPRDRNHARRPDPGGNPDRFPRGGSQRRVTRAR